MLTLPHALCSDLSVSGKREWLVTNGIGGFASGTVAGILTRRYHGLLIAALHPPMGRTLLVSKLDETLGYQGQAFPIYANAWASDYVEPEGFVHLERFHLEGTTPVWTYRLADAVLQKRVWMQHGANTTYVRYTLERASGPLQLSIKAMCSYRGYHNLTKGSDDWTMAIDHVPYGLRVDAHKNAIDFYLLSLEADAAPHHDWYCDYHLDVEAYRGLDALEDHLHAGVFTAELQPGTSVTMVLTTDPHASLDGKKSFVKHQAREASLLLKTPFADTDEPYRHLILAADQFLVERNTADGQAGHSIIAGYPWFGDWGRDTMIALPGLTLATGRPEIAASILRTFARYVDQGMLPNRFPDAGETPEYNTVDATLWYFEAIRSYLAATDDVDLIKELFPVLESIINHHREGTRYHIKADPKDHLLYAGEPGVQLTWMDAKVEEWVVTPRIGKPVEVNALWYNALWCMADFAARLGEPVAPYREMASAVRKSFKRFWNADTGYCYDVLDGPDGHDASLRPNQLFAVSLPHRALSKPRQKAVVDACSQHLLTPLGLRSLAPFEIDFKGTYGGSPHQRDGAYHQGTVWSWLMGPFCTAHLNIYQDTDAIRSFLSPLLDHLTDHCVGSISEIYDGDPPFQPRGAIAQAWGVAEVLRVWQTLGF